MTQSGKVAGGWQEATIESVCEVNPPKPNVRGVADSTPVMFVPMAAVDEVTGTVSTAEERPLGDVRNKSYRTFTSGDVLFAKITPCMENGKAAVVPDIPSGLGFGSTEFHVLRPGPSIERRYLWHFVRQETFRNDAERHMTSSVGQARVPKEFVEQTTIPIPPVSLQRQLVDLLDTATEKGMSAAAHVGNAKLAIKRFRQAVLAAACSGRLTADWREKHDLDEWTSEPALTACSRVQSGSTPKVWYTGDDGIPFLKVYNIVGQKLDFDYRPQFISPELHTGSMTKAQARPGDVLMNIVGPPLGKVAVVTDQYPSWSFNQALTLFRPSDKVTTVWLYIFLCSGTSVAEVMNETRGTVGQVNISLSQCRAFEIPLPSISEQQEIARIVNELFASADRVYAQTDAIAGRINRSVQAVLDKAFRGEIGPPVEAVQL